MRADIDHEQVERHEGSIVEQTTELQRKVNKHMANFVLRPLTLPWPVRFWRWLKGGRWPW